jgi:hypothetical protein
MNRGPNIWSTLHGVNSAIRWMKNGAMWHLPVERVVGWKGHHLALARVERVLSDVYLLVRRRLRRSGRIERVLSDDYLLEHRWSP